MGISDSLVLVGAAAGMVVVLFGLALYFMNRPRLYRR